MTTSTGDRQALEEERDFLLASLQQLEEEHAAGEITDEEHRTLVDQQTMRAAEVLRSLDPEGGTSRTPRSRLVRRGSDPRLPGRAKRDSGPGDEPATSPRRPLRKRLGWGLGIVTFVVVAGAGVCVATDERHAGDTVTGDVAKDPNTLLRQAQELTADGKALQAVKTYDAVIAKEPDNVQALAYRGWLVRLAGLPDEGLKSIDKAVTVDPTYPDAHFFRGFVLLRDKNDAAGAVGEFQTFLASNPPADMVPLVQQALQEASAAAPH